MQRWLDLAVALRDPFGLEPLQGKSVAIMADARFSGDSSIATDRLLRIVGEDRLKSTARISRYCQRSNSTRFILVSNELPDLKDSSNAIMSRVLMLGTN